ncbi:FkbM family methyltransferase [Nannocystaceae bacterium ST9]
MLNPKLIFDVGCHRGDDTAYYLAKGFDVVAIEANPALHRACVERFGAELASGRLRLLDVCVSDVEQTLAFFVNANDGWSSFVESIGTRGGDFRTITVHSVPLDRLIAEFGVPHFMKIDVEGAEDRLLRALQRCPIRPTVIALEVDFYEADPIADLERLGYDRFRIIRQPHLVADPELPSWEFTRCSSGPLEPGLLRGEGDDALQSAPQARDTFESIRQQSYRWHDLYAVRADDPAAQGWPHTPGS